MPDAPRPALDQIALHLVAIGASQELALHLRLDALRRIDAITRSACQVTRPGI